MPATQLGALPANQLNALPLQTAQAVASGGVANRNPGGGITRFWDSATLGMVATSPTQDGNGHWVMVSNFIDVYGCRRFSLLLTHTRTVLGAPLVGALTVQFQKRLNATDIPPTSLGLASNIDFTGSDYVGAGCVRVVFPALQVANEVQRALIGWDDMTIGCSGGGPLHGSEAMIGDNLRLFFDAGFYTGPVPPHVFSASLWATS
jgi:hypothetical protein